MLRRSRPRRTSKGASKTAAAVAIGIVIAIIVGVSGWYYATHVATHTVSKPVKLVVLARSGTYANGLMIAAKDFSKKYGVQVVVQPLSYRELHDKLAAEVMQKTGAFDVMMMDDPWLAEFASKGLLVNIGDMLKSKGITLSSDFIQSCINVCKYKGKLYALPYVGNVQLFVYRKDLFQKFGLTPPKTWTDVLNDAKIIYEKTNGQVYGYVIRGKKGNPIVTNFLPIFWGCGGRIIGPNGKADVYSPAGIKALKIFVALKKYCPPGTDTFGSAEVKSVLYQGKVAMSIIWPAWVPGLNNATKSKVAGKIGVMVAPGSRAMIGVWLLGIPVTSKHKDLALKFILFVLSKDEEKKLALEAGVPPTRASLYKDPDLVKKYPWYPVQLQALMTAKMRPRTPVWSQIEDTLANYLSLALSGSMSPEKALMAANNAINKILASSGS